MKQWLYVGELAEIGGIYKDTILDFKFWWLCDVKEWNSEYLELYGENEMCNISVRRLTSLHFNHDASSVYVVFRLPLFADIKTNFDTHVLKVYM